MATKNADEPLVNKGIPPPPPFPSPAEQLRTRICNTVFKTGPLYLSSKGIGWTSWKKRWFILTRTSLVFFRSDPSVVPQRGSEVNLTLGGIDLNNSGSVSVKEDKKLLTVFFPDGRDGRTFTLKAETLQELQEWKTALESALSQSPSYSSGQNENGLPVKNSVIGRPLLLALEDADGSPSFLEKALQFIEEHGVKVEGILRQAADVDDVEFRVREYEEGKTEFSLGEDAHVIADCIKYVLREMPSPPIPASCCKALLQACRTERNNRVNAMRTAICETFPEPNRCLLQRILKMMAKVALHKNENRMNSPAVAACMAPLLLRPLLAGECEIESDFDLGGDSSAQLIQAAAAANHAQAIVITLLDEYDKIFGEGIVSPEPYMDSEESRSESAEETDESYEDDDESQGSDPVTDNDPENASSATCSESGDSKDNTLRDDEDRAVVTDLGGDSEVGDENKRDMKSPSISLDIPPPQPHGRSNSKRTLNKNTTSSAAPANDSLEALRSTSSLASSATKSIGYSTPVSIQKSTTISNEPVLTVRNRGTWGRTSGRKNLSLESVDFGVEEEVEIQKLEGAKSELENKIIEEGKGTAVLQVNMDIRKKDLRHRRQALEKEVSKLQDKLQRERSIRVALEAGLHISHEPSPDLDTIDEKTKADLKDIAVAEADVVSLTQKLGELGKHFSLSREPHHAAIPKPATLPHKSRSQRTKLIDKQNDNETSSPPPFETSISKDSHLGDTEVEGKVESSLSSTQLPQIQKLDSLSSTNYRSVGATGNSSNPRPVVSRRSSAKRTITTRIEGTVPTTTALTRLTTRLNFLKERRNQIAHELQNMDIIRGSPRASQNQEKSREFNPNEEKNQGSEVQTSSISEKVENQTVRT